jgi:hypothetical protein
VLTIKGKLTIAKGSNEDEVRIYLDDGLAGCRAATARVSLDGFARALFAQGYIDCVVEINDSGVIGKIREHKVVAVRVPRDLAWSGNKDDEARRRALQRIVEDCPEAPRYECWEAHLDDFDNMHLREPCDVPGMVQVKVRFERWVDPPVEDA